ncbi:MAG: capsule assembly Wzi family protein [Gemmatimonadaceae bacterium]
MHCNTARWTATIACALMLGSAPRVMRAQIIGIGEVTSIGSETEERQRLSQLVGDSAGGTSPFRSLSVLSPKRTSLFTLLPPEVRTTHNSAIPYSLNDGAMWAGRGTSTLYTAGVDVRVRMVRLVLAPQFTTSQNRSFQTIPYPQGTPEDRDVWANPFYPTQQSLDFPMRFGDHKISRGDFGQSSLTASVHGVDAGVATENVWWGPSQRNAIVLSNTASGFAHLFVQTQDGLQTPVGRFDAQYLLGQLKESDFFDDNPANDVRSLSGLIASYTPSRFRGFNVGFSRVVIAPGKNGHINLSDLDNVFRDVGHPNTTATDIKKGAGADQITSLFARVVIPNAHFETYAEWARFEWPLSLRDLLETPGHSQGYTLGLQWARALPRSLTLKLAGEGTYLEPDASVRRRPVPTSYTSRSVVQGFTNRGQLLGAAIGPGASSQWAAVDVFGARFRAGGYLSRIRWDNATLWTPIVPQLKNEDVSVIGGLKGSVTFATFRLGLEYAQAARLDYLYQDRNDNYDLGTHKGVDILNRTLSITLSTAVGR